MSFEQNFQSYLAFFNGSERDFCEVQNLFDGMYTLMGNLHEHERVMNSDKSTLKDVQASVENILHDDLMANIEGALVGKAQLRDDILKDFAAKTKIHFLKMEVLDQIHINVILTKNNNWRCHKVFTVAEGKIAMIETANNIEDLVNNLNRNDKRLHPSAKQCQFDLAGHGDNLREYLPRRLVRRHRRLRSWPTETIRKEIRSYGLCGKGEAQV